MTTYDRYGDPLPLPALARIGSARLRHPPGVRFVLFPSENYLLTIGDNVVRCWDVASGSCTAPMPDGSLIQSAALASGNDLLATATGDEFTLRNWKTGAVLQKLEHSYQDSILGMACLSDSTWIIGSKDRIEWFDVKLRKVLRRQYAKGVVLVDLVDDKVVAGFDNGSIRAWDASSGKEVWTIKGTGQKVITFAVAANRLLVCDSEGHIAVVDMANLSKVAELQLGVSMSAAKVSPDGKRIAVGTETQIQVRQLADGEVVWGQDCDTEINAIAFSAQGRTLACALPVPRIAIWDAENGRDLNAFKGPPDIAALSLSPDSQSVAVAGSRSITVWSIANGEEAYRLRGHAEHTTAVAFSPDAQLISSTGFDERTLLWNVATQQPQLIIEGGLALGQRSLAFAAKGEMLVCGEDTRGKSKILLINVKDGRIVRTFEYEDDLTAHPLAWRDDEDEKFLTASCVGLSPDGSLLLSAGFESSDDGSAVVHLWDLARNGHWRMHGHTDYVKCLVVSSSDCVAATGSVDGSIVVWDLNRREQCWSVNAAHDGPVKCLGFSADGQMLVSGGEDRMVRVWSTDTETPFQEFAGHSEWVTGVAFFRDGKRVISGSNDSTLLIWPLRKTIP